ISAGVGAVAAWPADDTSNATPNTGNSFTIFEKFMALSRTLGASVHRLRHRGSPFDPDNGATAAGFQKRRCLHRQPTRSAIVTRYGAVSLAGPHLVIVTCRCQTSAPQGEARP